jgi:hypothetical protein
MLVLPLVPLAMLATFLTGMIGLVFPTLADIFGVLAFVFLAYIIQIATWFAALPFASFIVPAFPFPVMVLAYVLIGWCFYTLRRRSTQSRPAIVLTEVANWTIEEESAVWATQKAKERPLTERSQTDGDATPIFFR